MGVADSRTRAAHGADDLTRRARTYAGALHGSADAALVSELADEVDRLRGSVVWAGRKWGEALIERDAARAALERVRSVVETAELATPTGKPPYWTSHILNALEGES